MFKKFNILLSSYLKNKKMRNVTVIHSLISIPGQATLSTVLREGSFLKGRHCRAQKIYPLKGGRMEMVFLHQMVRGSTCFFLSSSSCILKEAS